MAIRTKADPNANLTVVMPARNAERYLERAVRSVVESQDVDPLLIVVDDASTDATPEILRHLQAEYPGRLHVERTRAQVGANAARNLVLPHVTGEFVGFVDADDYVTPDRFAVMLDLANRTGSGFVLDDVAFVREGAEVGTLFADRRARELLNSSVRELALSEFVHYDLGVGQPLVAAGVATQEAFPADVRHTGDFEYFFRCLASAGVAHTTNSAGYWYRRHGASMTGAWYEGMVADSRATTGRCLAVPGIDEPTRAALRHRLARLDRLEDYHRIRQAAVARRPAALALALRHPAALATGVKRHLTRRA